MIRVLIEKTVIIVIMGGLVTVAKVTEIMMGYRQNNMEKKN